MKQTSRSTRQASTKKTTAVTTRATVKRKLAKEEEEEEKKNMWNASSVYRRHSSAKRCRSRRPNSLLFITLVAIVVQLCCLEVTRAEDGYSIPADAIRIEAKELAADRLTEHLAGLIGNDSSSANSLDSTQQQQHDQLDANDLEEEGDEKGEEAEAEERELEEQEERVEADDHHLPTALARLNTLLRAAEERKERFEMNAATSRLLSINRGGFFRGRKFHCHSYLCVYCYIYLHCVVKVIILFAK